MHIVIAPSGFKESLDAGVVAAAIAEGVRRVLPEATVDRIPLVDGGEGSAKALAGATGGKLVPVPVTGRWARRSRRTTACWATERPR